MSVAAVAEQDLALRQPRPATETSDVELPQLDDAEIGGLEQLLRGFERGAVLGRRQQRREPALHSETVGLARVDRTKPPIHRPQLLVTMLGCSGEEQRVGPRDLLDQPVL